jgi:pyruvate dehydrogenase E2 component (dihydrolipoamide acetyltransferase)
MEIESFAEGVLLEIRHQEGESVSTGEIVAYIGEKGEKWPEDENTGKADAIKGDGYQTVIKKDAGLSDDDPKTLASPAARLLAKQQNLNLDELGNKFPGQILTRADVENHLRKNSFAVEPEEECEIIAVSPMRRIIARRMAESVLTVPSFNISIEVDMTAAIVLRQELNSSMTDGGVKVAFNDILMKCAATAVEKNRMINSSFGEERIKIYKDVNFGLAVGLENGLAVPVVRQVNRKSIRVIAKENSANIAKARQGDLQTAQMTGGTITLSSLGSSGVERFTAIINPPESCILAVGSVIEKPVVQKGEIVPRPMMNITASFDHRVIDGAAGAAFLTDMKRLLEDPSFGSRIKEECLL